MTEVTVVDRAGASRVFEVPEGERILIAGLKAGVGLPHECATGTCGTCKARLGSGETVCMWPGAPGARKCRDGDILMCQHAASGAVRLTVNGTFAGPPEPPVQAFSGTLSRSESLAGDAGLFALRLDRAMDYKAGQFVLVSVPGVEGARAYSMTTFEPGGAGLEFLIQRKPDGGLSRVLFDGSHAEWPVRVTGPFGRATFETDENRPFVAIAGGSGIAGILGILDHAMQGAHFARHRSSVYFGLRSPARSYMLERLSRYAESAGDALRVTVAFSDEAADTAFTQRHPRLKFASGLVHEVAGSDLPHGVGQAPVHFVAGPPAMVDAAMRMLVMQLKISPAEIRYDRFQ
ncbi:MAG: 2Fe-2S iron-sulfur cluster-binding protein [Hyphomicrobiales bacterium]